VTASTPPSAAVASATPAPLDGLAALVLKDGVMLGGLSPESRSAALALAWASLPPTGVLSEPQVNATLKPWLADAGRFLDTDHVELRRWLVDLGWLARDGFGREYRRQPVEALQRQDQGVAQALAAIDAPAWVASLRAAAAAQRDARRQAWQARQP
jgi:Uncharacterized protein conserved in bacteria (DUF2087)